MDARNVTVTVLANACVTAPLTLPRRGFLGLLGLRAAGASALARLASADTIVGCAVALGLGLAVLLADLLDLGLLRRLGLLAGSSGAGRLAGLEGSQVLGLVVNVEDLLLALLVELAETLTGGRAGSLLEVGAQALPSLVGLVGDAVLLVHGLGALGGVVLLVEVLQGLCEAVADTVLLVHLDGALHDLIAQDVAMGEILGDNARARLVLLRDVIVVGVASGLTAGCLIERLSRGDVDLSRAQLGVVEQEGCLGGSLFFERDGGRLGSGGLAGLGRDGEGLDLAAVIWVSTLSIKV
jgi:hypothetical protein